MNKLIRLVKAWHKNIPEDYFNNLTYDELLCWLHPIDRAKETKTTEGNYDNIFTPQESRKFNH